MSNDAVRRIMAELKELSSSNAQPLRLFHAQPLESDLFEWHFSFRGPPDTPFEGGVYHGRILLPPEYPLKPPEIILLTPNGRFEVGKRICLSVTAHHQETWQPSWGIRTILTALIGFMPTSADGLGALDYPDEDRKRLAKKSHLFKCNRCEVIPAQQLPALQGLLGGKQESTLGNEIEVGTKIAATNAEQTSITDSSCTTTQGSSSSDSSTTLRARAESTQTPRTTARSTTAVATATSNSLSNTRSTKPRGENMPPQKQEKELLYIAYAIVAIMIGIILRRMIKIMTD